MNLNYTLNNFHFIYTTASLKQRYIILYIENDTFTLKMYRIIFIKKRNKWFIYGLLLKYFQIIICNYYIIRLFFVAFI